MKKTIQIKELKGKETRDLFRELADTEKKISELRFKASFKKLKNYREITMLRKKVAWIWTILSERTSEELAKSEKPEVKNVKV